MTEKSGVQKEMEALTNALKTHNYNYYVLAQPTISDRVFDEQLKKLSLLEEAYPQFKDPNSPTTKVGGEITKAFETVKHSEPMLSLSNTYNEEELKDFVDRTTKILERETEFTCELKFDGFAIALQYEEGKLTKAITRGNGVEGDDVTANVKTIRSIPHQLSGNYPEKVEVRGEVFMHKKAFDKLNAEREKNGETHFANPRNSAAGTIKMQNQDEVAKRPLDCFIYALQPNKQWEINNHLNALNTLKTLGLPVADQVKLCNNFDDLINFIKLWDKERKNLSFDIDGVVIKVNNFKDREQLGYTAKSPRWAIAYKFETERALTQLLDVKYQVGRTGAITPVAQLDPVLLLGTTVKRASLHNQDIMRELDICKNDFVYVEKGGEIIPKIVGVAFEKRTSSTPISFIENCPECNTPLVRAEGEAAHYCPNTAHCPPQIKGKIEHFISRKALNIDSLGEGKIEILFDHGLIKNAADLYALQAEDILGLTKTYEDELTGETRTVSFKEKSTDKIISGIAASKQIPFEKVLYGLGIRFVGETVAKKLARSLKSMEAIQTASKESLVAIEEIGEKIAESIANYFTEQDHVNLVNRLAGFGLKMTYEQAFEQKSESLDGKKIVISGVFNEFSRTELKQMVEENGGQNVSSISAKTDFILAGENMGPSKLEKANKLGIRLVTETEFKEMINLA